jgi:hypothetical protein
MQTHALLEGALDSPSESSPRAGALHLCKSTRELRPSGVAPKLVLHRVSLFLLLAVLKLAASVDTFYGVRTPRAYSLEGYTVAHASCQML